MGQMHVFGRSVCRRRLVATSLLLVALGLPAIVSRRLALGQSPPATTPSATTPAKAPPAKTTPPSKTPPSTDLPRTPGGDEATAPPGTQLLYQDVVIARRPAFEVAGLTIAQDLQYRVLSKLFVGSRGSDGKLSVRQVIYETKLEKADGLSEAVFRESLRALQGQELRYTLDAKNELVQFAGPKDTRKVVKADGLGGEGFLLSSVMDDDGWRELAQLSFLLPPAPLKSASRWERKLTHDWGALGSWYGKPALRFSGQRDGQQRVDYAHQLAYKPPGKEAKDGPLQITSADFKVLQAGGQIALDAKTGRVVQAVERFQVRGAVTTTVLGQSVPAQVEESQVFSLRILDRLPSGK